MAGLLLLLLLLLLPMLLLLLALLLLLPLLLLALLLLLLVLQLLLVFVMLLLLLLLPTGFCSFTKNADRVFVVCWLFNHFWCLSLLQCSRSASPTLDMSTPQPQRYFPTCCIATKQRMRSADTQVCRYTQSDQSHDKMHVTAAPNLAKKAELKSISLTRD